MARYDWTGPATPGTARERVVKRFDGAAGNAEHILDTNLLQIGDNQVDRFDRMWL